MRYLLNLLLVCMLVSIVQAEEKFIVPAEIRYKEAPAKVNEEARQALKKLFTVKTSDQTVLSLFETNALICGPGLWRTIRSDPALAKIEKGIVEFQMPVLDHAGNISRMDKLEGKLFQSPDEVLLFWRAFCRRTDFTELNIRRLSPKELSIFWAMIPFDITEPLFILESGKHKILAVFTSPDKLKVSWIDDYQNISPRKDEVPNKPGAADGK